MRKREPRHWRSEKRIGLMSADELYMLILDHTTIDTQTGCWLWTARRSRNGYGNIKVHNLIGAHRISYFLEHGSIPCDGVIRHKCDVPACCNPKHLEHGTLADNARDSRERGRAKLDSRNRRGHLTEVLARQIYDLVKSGAMTYQQIADAYETDYDCVKMIRRGDTWAWATGVRKFRFPSGVTRTSPRGKALLAEAGLSE